MPHPSVAQSRRHPARQESVSVSHRPAHAKHLVDEDYEMKLEEYPNQYELWEASDHCRPVLAKNKNMAEGRASDKHWKGDEMWCLFSKTNQQQLKYHEPNKLFAEDLWCVLLPNLSCGSLLWLKVPLPRINLVSKRGFGEMTSKRVDALEGKMEQFKSRMKGKFSTMENQLRGMEEIMRKLLDMQSKTLPMVLMVNSNQNLTGILLAGSKGKDIEREEFNKESFFHQEPSLGASIWGGVAEHYGRHFEQGKWLIREGEGQEPPPRAPVRDIIGYSNGETAGREFRDEGGGVADRNNRSFGQGEWTAEEGRQAKLWGSSHVRRREEMWDSHCPNMEETWRDYKNRYTGGGRSYWGSSDSGLRKLKIQMIDDKEEKLRIFNKQIEEDKKLIISRNDLIELPIYSQHPGFIVQNVFIRWKNLTKYKATCEQYEMIRRPLPSSTLKTRARFWRADVKESRCVRRQNRAIQITDEGGIFNHGKKVFIHGRKAFIHKKPIGRDGGDDEETHGDPIKNFTGPIRGRSRFPDEGKARRKLFGGGGKVVDHYRRHFGQGEWVVGEGEGQQPPPRALIRDRIGWWGGRPQWEVFWVRRVDDQRSRGTGRTMGIKPCEVEAKNVGFPLSIHRKNMEGL
ncbi:hypothetical protein M5K25_021077 [Dendrobium thyrsiflorum]|uniref:Uncharacterized protein n=1 Tax=Dendrobium thyrsiflorum TaxID=117978 RepID=A0ABD0UBK1_DENTH